MATCCKKVTPDAPPVKYILEMDEDEASFLFTILGTVQFKSVSNEARKPGSTLDCLWEAIKNANPPADHRRWLGPADHVVLG